MCTAYDCYPKIKIRLRLGMLVTMSLEIFFCWKCHALVTCGLEERESVCVCVCVRARACMQ
jgi:hypothetical protein